MLIRELVQRFEKQAPVGVMVRAALENAFSAERLNDLFEKTATLQTNRNLLFSSIADLMGLVALKIHPSVHAGYQAQSQRSRGGRMVRGTGRRWSRCVEVRSGG